MKNYTGRLAFDPDTLFHLSEDGKPVVTDDGGATWRYATEADTSHNARYQQRVLVVDSTANRLAALALEHGRVKAEALLREEHPHHFEVQADDLHFDGVRSDPDHLAATVTSHTEAYT